MSKAELEQLEVFSAASPSDLKFAASEALAAFDPEIFSEHCGGPLDYRPAVKSVERLDQENAIVSFYPRYRFWGERVAPFTMPIAHVAMKLEAISLARSAISR
ncbi:MAG: hypothetical protein AAF661_06960 [Pseudomonadota bacterium]